MSAAQHSARRIEPNPRENDVVGRWSVVGGRRSAVGGMEKYINTIIGSIVKPRFDGPSSAHGPAD